MTRQTVQHQPGVVAAAGHEPLEYPRRQGKMLILQQRPGLQDSSEKLQIRTSDIVIGPILSDQFAQIRPKIEVQAGLPSPSPPGEQVA
jgi:hypothetical protein